MPERSPPSPPSSLPPSASFALTDEDDEQGPVSVIPPAPASITMPPPSSASGGPAYPDPEAILVALVLSPASYPRNRFFALFNVPSLRKARWRAAQLRGLVNALARPPAPISDYSVAPHDGHGKLLSYNVPSLNLRVRAFLLPHEAAVVELAVARIRGEPSPPDALALVNDRLARLAPDIRPAPPPDAEALRPLSRGLSPPPSPTPHRPNATARRPRRGPSPPDAAM